MTVHIRKFEKRKQKVHYPVTPRFIQLTFIICLPWAQLVCAVTVNKTDEFLLSGADFLVGRDNQQTEKERKEC